MTDTATFYDSIAASYHNIFPDWQKTIYAQGGILADIIRSRNHRALSVRDCTCGIGTQSLGLALLGFSITASDVSPQAIARAEREAEERGLAIDFSIADVCDLPEDHSHDVVIAMDNAIAHVQSVEELRIFLKRMLGQASDGAALMVSVRDYAPILLERPTGSTPALREYEGQQHAYLQIWDWVENEPRYEATLMLLERAITLDWRIAASARSIFRAWTLEEIRSTAIHAGWGNVEILEPASSKFYQPIVVGEAR